MGRSTETKGGVDLKVIYAPIRYTPLEITLDLPKGLEVFEFLPNRIRSLLASSFLETVCTQDGRCEACLLASVCAYPAYFAPLAPDPFLVHTQGEIPPAFALAAPWKDRAFPPQSTLRFRLTLFGEPRRFLPYLVAGLRRFERRGLGRPWYPYRLQRVDSGPRCVYKRQEDRLHLPETLLFSPQSVPDHASSATLIFHSPTFLKNKAAPDQPPTFPDLLKALARRYSLLLHFYWGETWTPPRGFFDAARDIQAHFTDYRWHTFVRFSRRQQNHMPLEGFTGTLHLEGPLSPYLFLLLAGQHLQIGGKTTFGLGQYSVDLKGGAQ